MSDLVISPKVRVPLAELQFSYVRSSGPGGQNVNKVNSKAVLTWRVATSNALPAGVRERFFSKFGNRISEEGGIVISSGSYREQSRNKDACLGKLREMIKGVLEPPKKRVKTKPSKAAKARRIEEKKRRGVVKRERGGRKFDE